MLPSEGVGLVENTSVREKKPKRIWGFWKVIAISENKS